MNPTIRHRRRQAGMSLLEVLVAIVILSFGLIGLIGLQARAVQLSVGAEDTNRAALFANEIVSQMWMTRTTTLSTAVINAWQARIRDVENGGLPNGRGTVAVDSGVATITVLWQPTSNSAGNDNRYVTQVMVTLP